MKTFLVKSEDLLDEKKNPHYILSARKILKNKKIRKYPVKKETNDNKKSC